jgi:hypothetical protein
MKTILNKHFSYYVEYESWIILTHYELSYEKQHPSQVHLEQPMFAADFTSEKPESSMDRLLDGIPID